MARGEITVHVKCPGLADALDRIDAAVGRLERLMKVVAISQICGILEVAARERGGA